MVEKTVKVKIDNFECDERYYSFNYEVWVDNELTEEGEYDNDHSWEDLVAFEDMMLNGGEAVKIILNSL